MSYPFKVALIILILGSLMARAQTRMIPHVTRAGGGFVSTVIVENNAVVEKTITLMPFDSSGVELTHRSLTVPATGVVSDDATLR